MIEKLFFLCSFSALVYAQAPVITGVDPIGSTVTGSSIEVKVAGLNLRSIPGKSIQIHTTGGQIGTVILNPDGLGGSLKFMLTIAAGTPTILITVDNGAGVSNAWPFLTGVVATGSDTNCSASGDATGGDATLPVCGTLRWEIDSNAATATNGQTNSQTTPDIIFKLDYQVKSPSAYTMIGGAKSFTLDRNNTQQGMGDRFAAHLIFRSGITQATVANTVQTLASSSSSCSGSSSAGCMKTVVGQQAFLAEASGTVGWSMGQKGNGGGFVEAGFKGRGAFQQLIAKDQIVQSGGISYAVLSQNNPQSTVGIYEGTARVRIGQHDTKNYNPQNGNFSNTDDLLVIEAGYQNNSGLNHLNAASPQSSTRNRFVGRFFAYPEIDHKTHTKVLLGVEYNSGLFNGGLKDVRYFYGINADILKLLKPDPKN